MILWLCGKLIGQRKYFFEPATVFSLWGIALGVAFLIVSMSCFSGFTKALQKSIVDISGDIIIFKKGGWMKDSTSGRQQIKDFSSQIEEVLPYYQMEVLASSSGELSTVFLQGLPWEAVPSALQIMDRRVGEEAHLKKGFSLPPSVYPAYLGKVVAKKLNLKSGDRFKTIWPRVSKSSTTQISPKVFSFYVQGVVDLGKYEFNERVIVAPLKALQTLSGRSQRVKGFRLKLKDSNKSLPLASLIQEKMGWKYVVQDWSQMNASLFKAIIYEKRVLFFVMLIMVVAAFFNVSTILYLAVLRRYSQVAVLKSLGVSKRSLVVLFSLQGLLLGAVGLCLGIFLGLVFCLGFDQVQKFYPILPESIYKMSGFSTHVEILDLLWVSGSVMGICFLSTWFPSLRGASLSPVEGLKYE